MHFHSKKCIKYRNPRTTTITQQGVRNYCSEKVIWGLVMPYLTNIRLFTPTYFEQAHILPRTDFKGKCPAVFQLSFFLLTDALLLRSPWESGLLPLLHILKGFLDKKLCCFLPLTSVPVTPTPTAVVQRNSTMWEEGIRYQIHQSFLVPQF